MAAYAMWATVALYAGNVCVWWFLAPVVRTMIMSVGSHPTPSAKVVFGWSDFFGGHLWFTFPLLVAVAVVHFRAFGQPGLTARKAAWGLLVALGVLTIVELFIVA